MMGHHGEILGTGGRYELVGLIASGAMGRVHLARYRPYDGGSTSEVAIKRVRPELGTNPEIVEMFEDEAQISLRLHHPNIVRAFEVGRVEGSTFLAMERVAGVTLEALSAQLAASSRVLPVDLVLEIVARILDALDHAHGTVDDEGVSMGVVHRDVSPQNVMISFGGEVKLFDFGVGQARGNRHRTNPGLVKGKLAYMSPEQIRNLPFDGRSDLFSVGVLAYEGLVLVHPFFGKTDALLMRSVLERPPPDPRSVDPELPDELAGLLLRALEKDPERRFQSAREMREAIERFVVGRVFPPGPSLGELVQSVFADRIRMEARARRRGDDALLVRALRGELDDAEARLAVEVDRSEHRFADLPTASHDVSKIADLSSEDGPRVAPAGPARPGGPGGYASQPTLLSEATQARALSDLRVLVEATPTPLFVAGVDDGQLLFANDEMVELFGLAAEGPIGFSMDRLYANPSDRARLAAKGRAEAPVRDWVVEMRRRDGTRFWASLSVRLAVFRNERVHVGAVLDVTERVRIESRLARRVGHEHRLVQAAAALLRARDADGAGGEILQALEHLRAATEADRVLLGENEVGPDGALVIGRRHTVGIEATPLARDAPLSWERIPRWRTLLERGDVVRGVADAFPESERSFLDALGVTSILAAPVGRRGQWLGVLALAATRRHRRWSDEDVVALETMAGLLAGALERRRRLAPLPLGPEPAGWVSAGARLGDEISGWIDQLQAVRAGGAALSELDGLAGKMAAARAGLPPREPGQDPSPGVPSGRPRSGPSDDAGPAPSGSGSIESPDLVDVVEHLRGRAGLRVRLEAELPPTRVPRAALERFLAVGVEELARALDVRVEVAPTPAGELRLRICVNGDDEPVWAALEGDLAALTRPGSRIGGLSLAVEALGGELRIERGDGLVLVVELPPAPPSSEDQWRCDPPSGASARSSGIGPSLR